MTKLDSTFELEGKIFEVNHKKVLKFEKVMGKNLPKSQCYGVKKGTS